MVARGSNERPCTKAIRTILSDREPFAIIIKLGETISEKS